jgi:hypothetical protein
MFAVVTAIVGAALGANGLLLALDIAWDTQRREREAAEALEPRPSW